MKTAVKRAGTSVNALGWLLVIGSLLIPFLYYVDRSGDALPPAIPWIGVITTLAIGAVMVLVGRSLKSGSARRGQLPALNTALILAVAFLIVSALGLDVFGVIIGGILTWELIIARRAALAG